jgi:GMP synthase-like glutamine amidotransferase
MLMKTKKTDLVLGYTGLGRTDGDNITPFDRLFKYSTSLIKKGAFDMVDAIVLWGGTDVHPSLYGQKRHPCSQVPMYSQEASARDTAEWYICREAWDRKIPIIGVCRGAQLLCVFSGGSLYQDVSGHDCYHKIQTKDGDVFEAPAGHHQMMNLDGTKYELLAWPYDWKSGENGPKTTLSTRYDRETLTSERGAHLLESKKEPEVVWFPETRSFAIQPHPEWVHPNQESPFLNWLLKEIESRVS